MIPNTNCEEKAGVDRRFPQPPQPSSPKVNQKGFPVHHHGLSANPVSANPPSSTPFSTPPSTPTRRRKSLATTPPKTVEIQTISADVEENGVKLKLSTYSENIEARYDAYLEQENRVNRKKITDTRVHACLYFVAPTGHSLKPLDVEFMKRLHHRVNLIPVIAKSDTLTEDEIKAFKIKDLGRHQRQQDSNLPAPLPTRSTIPRPFKRTRTLLAAFPLPVVGSDKEVDVGGKKVDNEDHCDFVKLRQMLIRTHMEELKEAAKIAAGGGDLFAPAPSLRRNVPPTKPKMAKMEAEMKAVFQQKVAEKESKLKQSEDDLYARHREMKEQLEKQRIELEEKKRRLLGQSGVDKNKPKPKGTFFNK
ncbi:Septin-domain-containing protein [Chytridium lagenaria]|nr:Septin-domain-containing protein [Chytridium lagenaria]